VTEEISYLVLGHTEVGEADRVVRLLSSEHQRFSVFARGARHSGGRFGGLLELGVQLRAAFKPGRGELPLLSQAELVRAPLRAREDLRRIALLGWGCELVACFAPSGAAGAEGGAGRPWFGLLASLLARLEEPSSPGEALRLGFEAKVLAFAGFRPALVRCAASGQPLPESEWVVFDVEAGGALVSRPGQGPRVRAADLAELEVLLHLPLQACRDRADPAPAVRWLLADLLEFQVGRPLRSRGLLSL
jgi:DNA repair protein RecO